MKFLGNRQAVLPIAIAATLAVGMPQASAQGLFDMLFGGGIRHSPQGEFPPPPKSRKIQSGASAGGGGVRISSRPGDAAVIRSWLTDVTGHFSGEILSHDSPPLRLA